MNIPLDRKLVVALACRNQGTRLYGKPLQNLNIEKNISVIDNVIQCLGNIDCIDDIVLGIAEGNENISYVDYSKEKNLTYIIGDETDVLQRLILSGDKAGATDIFRTTSESPFPCFEFIQKVWDYHNTHMLDATFFDDVIDGCGFEIIRLDALKKAHKEGEDRHRSEFCTLYIRENIEKFRVRKDLTPEEFHRRDLRLTVDNPEDLVVCRAVYNNFFDEAPMIPLSKIIKFLDSNPSLKNLIEPFTEKGYETMYIWNSSE